MALQGFPHVLPESVEKPGHALARSIDSRASPRRVPTKESIPQPSLLSFAFVRLQRRVENETLPATEYTLTVPRLLHSRRPPFLSCISTSNVNTRSNDSSQAWMQENLQQSALQMRSWPRISARLPRGQPC